jgi:hypothetical protein
MTDKTQERKLTMAIPNGIILALIGVLVLLTLLTSEFSREGFWMNVVAGGVLVVGGLVSLVLGLRRMRLQ